MDKLWRCLLVVVLAGLVIPFISISQGPGQVLAASETSENYTALNIGRTDGLTSTSVTWATLVGTTTGQQDQAISSLQPYISKFDSTTYKYGWYYVAINVGENMTYSSISAASFHIKTGGTGATATGSNGPNAYWNLYTMHNDQNLNSTALFAYPRNEVVWGNTIYSDLANDFYGCLDTGGKQAADFPADTWVTYTISANGFKYLKPDPNGYIWFAIAPYIGTSNMADPSWATPDLSNMQFATGGGADLPYLTITGVEGTPSASIKTLTATSKYPDKFAVTLQGLVLSLGQDSVLQVNFEWGLDTEYGNTTTLQAIRRAGLYGYFEADLVAVEYGVVYHYRAKGTGTLTGTIYGDDMAFILSLGEETNLVTLPVNMPGYIYATFGAFMVAMGQNTTENITLEYGTDLTLEGELIIDENVTIEGKYYLVVDMTAQTPGDRLFYRVKGVGDYDTAYGEVRVMVVPNPNKAGFINWIDQFMEAHGIHYGVFWWLLLILLCALALVIGAFFGKWGLVCAAILDAVLIMGWLAMSLIDPWIVVPIMVIAVTIIFGLIFRGKTTSGE